MIKWIIDNMLYTDFGFHYLLIIKKLSVIIVCLSHYPNLPG